MIWARKTMANGRLNQVLLERRAMGVLSLPGRQERFLNLKSCACLSGKTAERSR